MGKQVDFRTFRAFLLAPGKVQTVWFTWDFTVYDYVHFDANPITDGASVQIVTQWSEWKNPSGANPMQGKGVIRYVTFKNNGKKACWFVPRCIRVPNKY